VVFLTSGDGSSAGSPTGSDTITNFMQSDDKIIIGGALAVALDEGDQIFNGWTLDSTIGDAQDIDLSVANTREYLFIDNSGGEITLANLTDTNEVATVFAAEANLLNSSAGRDLILGLESTTSGTFGLYYFSDTTLNTGAIDAEEISVLAVVSADTFSHGYFQYDFA